MAAIEGSVVSLQKTTFSGIRYTNLLFPSTYGTFFVEDSGSFLDVDDCLFTQNVIPEVIIGVGVEE